ncbi:hypothetical protein Bca101_046830 [Brassica carinata]
MSKGMAHLRHLWVLHKPPMQEFFSRLLRRKPPRPGLLARLPTLVAVVSGVVWEFLYMFDGFYFSIDMV